MEAEEEESAEVLAASAAEDELYQAADAATHADPAPPAHGRWAAESLDLGATSAAAAAAAGADGDARSGYRERQQQANALREALDAARAAKAARAAA
jgi:hypothetical protein